jgi:hypothetical protein
MPEFWETKGDHKFYYGTAPRIAKAPERIADALVELAKRRPEPADTITDAPPTEAEGLPTDAEIEKARSVRLRAGPARLAFHKREPER